MNWIKERPVEEGWYFWRKSKVQSDPRKWNAYFISDEGDGEEMCGKNYRYSWCWDAEGANVYWPKGGWWCKIDTREVNNA